MLQGTSPDRRLSFVTVQASAVDKQPVADNGTTGSGEEVAWKARDPYQFLPAPEENCKVHTEVTFSDGTVKAFANSKEQLHAHLKATGGKVCSSAHAQGAS
jgi:hypothetical protein